MLSRFRAAVFPLLALFAASAFAVQPQFLRISAMRDFLEGEIEGLSVDSSGRLSLAPAASVPALPKAASAGSCAAGAMGALMFGPSTSASPHQHIAQDGSSSRAARKARRASAWLKP